MLFFLYYDTIVIGRGKNMKNIFVLHSLNGDTGCIGKYLEGYNYFDGYHNIYKIPELNELISTLF